MLKKSLASWVTRSWYQGNVLLSALRPLALFFQYLSLYRKKRLSSSAWLPPIPTIIVGNITVGGTGKTPVVIHLAKFLQTHGLQPIILSRGYGGKYQGCVVVTAGDQAETVGDEPLLLKQQSGAAVVIGRSRVAAAKFALRNIKAQPSDLYQDPRVFICDDGLQHYHLGRHTEIAVIDAARLFGNQRLLPEGPLREPLARLAEVDMILLHGDKHCMQLHQHMPTLPSKKIYTMHMIPTGFCAAGADKTDGSGEQLTHLTVQQFQQQFGYHIKAVAATGNPSRFFISLQQLGFHLDVYEFPDHHLFARTELTHIQQNKQKHLPVVMTSKDAVKCQKWRLKHYWYLQIRTEIEGDFMQNLLDSVKKRMECSYKAEL